MKSIADEERVGYAVTEALREAWRCLCRSAAGADSQKCGKLNMFAHVPAVRLPPLIFRPARPDTFRSEAEAVTQRAIACRMEQSALRMD